LRPRRNAWHVYLPGHPLARGNGWAVAARVALYEYTDGDAYCEAPNCRGTNLFPGRPAHLSWGSGRGMAFEVVAGERRPRAVVWFRDGDQTNLSRDNLRAACMGCVLRTLRSRGGAGRPE
jgi:hypothetical protein